jgi:hypothetical protein
MTSTLRTALAAATLLAAFGATAADGLATAPAPAAAPSATTAPAARTSTAAAPLAPAVVRDVRATRATPSPFDAFCYDAVGANGRITLPLRASRAPAVAAADAVDLPSASTQLAAAPR